MYSDETPLALLPIPLSIISLDGATVSAATGGLSPCLLLCKGGFFRQLSQLCTHGLISLVKLSSALSSAIALVLTG